MTSAAPLHLGPWIPCATCSSGYPLQLERLFEDYFTSLPIVCPGCGNAIDWWQAVLSAVREHFMLVGAFHAIGAQSTVIKVPLQKNVAVEVDLTEFEIPADAVILAANFSGTGDIFPILWHGNTPGQDPLNKSWLLYGAPFNGSPIDSKAQVMVTWIAPPAGDVSLSQLVDAARAYDAGRFSSLVVPANVAVECQLAAACSSSIFRPTDIATSVLRSSLFPGHHEITPPSLMGHCAVYF